MEDKNHFLSVNANGNATPEDYSKLFGAYYEMLADLTKVKEAVFKVMEVTGMINTDGTFKDKMDFKKISGMVAGMLMNPAALQEKFSFLKESLPLLEKYKEI